MNFKNTHVFKGFRGIFTNLYSVKNYLPVYLYLNCHMRWRKIHQMLAGLFCLFSAGAAVSQTDSTWIQTGTASYYAKKFEGRRCSCGEKFRNDSLTAAHKTLPFGTKVRVTNLKNDSTVVVRINDRLPKKSKRVIDLTRRAAKQLNFIQAGLTKVKLEVLRDSLP